MAKKLVTLGAFVAGAMCGIKIYRNSTQILRIGSRVMKDLFEMSEKMGSIRVVMTDEDLKKFLEDPTSICYRLSGDEEPLQHFKLIAVETCEHTPPASGYYEVQMN